MRRRHASGGSPEAPPPTGPALCALCGRPLPEDSTVDEHHLMPRSHGGRDTIRLHKICHQTIHATLSERELADYYHTIARLQTHPALARFILWVRKRPEGFYDRTRFTQRRRGA